MLAKSKSNKPECLTVSLAQTFTLKLTAHLVKRSFTGIILMNSFTKSRHRMLQKTLFLIVFLWFGGISGHRVRRHLVFNKGSRVFFSVNVRDNLFNYSKLFAQVFGFKMDWDLPHRIVQGVSEGRIQRRDLYEKMEHLLYRQNLNGTSCIGKFLCEASTILPKSNHFLAQFYEIIFSGENENTNVENKKCAKMLQEMTVEDCPLSLMSIFSGSDIDFGF